jgi:ATP-dependent Clp protease protease subunit
MPFFMSRSESKEIRKIKDLLINIKYFCVSTKYTMAVLKIYNDIQTENEKNICKFWGGAEGVCFKDVDEFCESIPDDDNAIDVRLHCDGGSVVEGWGIYDRLRAAGKEITCTVEGNAASMATVIMMAAPRERRRAYKSALICVHNPWVPGYALGDTLTSSELEKAATDLKEMQEKMLNLYVERCECDREEMQALMDEDKYIGVERAKEFGLIGEIIAPASAKKQGLVFNNKNSKKMAKEKDEKVEVKASLLDRALARLGLKNIDDLAKGMDLSTSDGQTLTVEREEGEPQVGDKASPDGTFVMPNGKTIIVKDGVISDIQTTSSGSEEEEDGSELEKRVAELESEVKELQGKLETSEKARKQAEEMAKTQDDLRILNAVKIAGGEKALAKISSDYKPAPRKPEGANASRKAEGQEEVSPMRKEIEARRNGTYKNKK